MTERRQLPFIGVVLSACSKLPHLLTLVYDGPAALRDRYELVYRPRPSGRT